MLLQNHLKLDNGFLDLLYDLSKCRPSANCSYHVLQRITGCKLEKLPDGTKSVTVFDEYAFDGEDFISFNADTMKWIDKNPKAKETKEKWDHQTKRKKLFRHYFKNCSEWILTFNNTQKRSPDVHVFAKKSPDAECKLNLTCLATVFYPRDVEMIIRLNKTELENQTSSEIRPNGDETFQMRISVKIDRNHKGSYDLSAHSQQSD
ncbi:H-2 class I histocompatibility antigen, K-B alpha chain-like [Megalobrama amblycephala]|uniref:H-2 class I histocompatibility antigen, K-B alpha chain-like n=1 Tax=Megalobrama amblycephala TaxID=75352 RepID=UPI002013F4D8|nr:H-2 class I histocompatibility antigen, K-B alpha chain-like [Megalobrama amblycephala]